MTPEWIKTAKVGDAVVCIQRPEKLCIAGDVSNRDPLNVGQIYTIRHIQPMIFWDGGFALDVGISDCDGTTLLVSVLHFRPAHKSSTDKGMKVLKGILQDASRELESAE